MKAVWFVLGALALTVACSGERDDELGETKQALSYCRVPSFTGTITSAGVTPGVWTGSAMTAEVPLELTVSSNMPTGTPPGSQPQHLLDLGYSRPDGSFRVDARCTYKGKALTTGGYRSALVGCAPSNPGRVYAFNKATIQTSWGALPPAGTTWRVTAAPRELFDDDNACTADTCTAAGATHAYNASAPGCAVPSAPTGPGPADPALTWSVAEDAANLYALQGGTPGALDPRRAAIARGYVYETETVTGVAQLAQNVTVSILEHPELGTRVSRADGTYEFAVNGGGPMTLQYSKTGTLGAQRTLDLRWHEFRKVQDVQLLSHNDPGSPRLANQPAMQVARGRAESDARGSRRATILIPPGTTSPDVGSSWTVRVTEFTVGSDGPRRMPGALPDASGYTYAFAADIEEANGAHVTFNKPLIFYVEDFPGFAVGKKAPLGWYDESAGVWRAEQSGLVVNVLGVNNVPSPPRATIDINGDGSNDVGSPAFAALGITTEELEQLAALYGAVAPKKLIRVELPHLSKWDINWGMAPPNGAGGPGGGAPGGGSGGPCKTAIAGSILECESRTLAEELPIAGTPFTLRYQSDRTKARHEPIKIPLTGATMPSALPKRIDWKVNVAGREFTGASTNTALNQSVYFTWDGLDAFGRVVQGRTAMDVQVGHVYDGFYTDTSEFGYSGIGAAITGNPASGELTLWKADQVIVGAYDAAGLGLGGWSLSEHHVLDAENGDIHLGNGKTRNFDRSYRMSWVGGDETLPELDGVHIKNTSLGAASRAPSALAADPDGSIWFSQGALNTHPSDDAGIVRVRPDGITERITGIGAPPFADPADGMLASAVRMYGAFLRVGPTGDLYSVDYLGHRIWRITNETPRQVRLVAGDGGVCGGGDCGDGALATMAQLNAPSAIAFDTAGNVYFTDTVGGGGRVRRIDPNGIVSTLFATGFIPGSLEVDGLGKILVHNVNGHVYEWPLASDGSVPLSTIAATLPPPVGATNCANPSMYLDRMKRVGFACFDQLLLARDASSVQRIAGLSNDLLGILGNQSYGDGRTALQASFSYVNRGLLAAAPDGSLLIIDNGARIRRVQQQPLTANGTFQFPSEDGEELYEFGPRGKHIRTLSALTGAVRYQFGYGAGGELTSIVDGNGLTTTVTRPSANQVQFTSHYGKITTLNIHATTRLLTSLQNPGQSYSFTMSADGLLKQMTDSGGGNHEFEYDPFGYIDRDKDPSNATQVLSQTYLSKGIRVEAKTAMGLSTFFAVTDETDAVRGVAVQRRVRATPRNASYTDDFGADQVSVRTEASGTTVTRIAAADARYGAYAPAMTTTTKTPLNLTHFVSHATAATLASASDPLSVQTETRTVSENQASCASGSLCTPLNQRTVVYDRASNTRTHTSAMGRSWVETLDSKDRVVQVDVPGSASVTYSYDDDHVSQVTQGARTTTMTYVSGELASTQDAMGHVTSYTLRDPMGRARVIALPGGRTLGYEYDAAGNTTSITPPGAGKHLQGFDLRDLQTSFTVPNPNSGQTVTTFNADRQAAVVTFPAGYGINLLTYLQGLYVGISADTNVSRSITRDAAERVATMGTGTLDGVALGFTYDGHLQKSVTWSGNVAGAVGYLYDNHFQPNQLSVNATAAETRVFDADNLLTAVTLAGVTTTIGRDAQNGRINTVTTGNITETRSYDATYGELSGLSYVGTAGNIYTVTYLRDALGRVTSKTETRGTSPALTTTYDYDAAGRLTEEDRGGAVTTWLYDDNGNRTHTNGVFLGAADAQDRLPATYGGVSYTYQNATGDVTSKGAHSFSWDRLGNLRSVFRPFPASTVTYQYDAQERRVAKKLGPSYSKKWLYDGQLRVIAELNASNAVQKRFVYGSRENVPDTMLSGGVTYRLVTDHLGSVVAVVNTSGATMPASQTATYDAWGNMTETGTTTLQPFRFAGGLYDADLALVHFGARDYDPATGRWMSKDQARWGGGLNFYAYANNDPVNYIDRTGRSPEQGGSGFGGGGASGSYDDPDDGPDDGGPCETPAEPPPPPPKAQGCYCKCADGTHWNASNKKKCDQYCGKGNEGTCT